MGYQWGVGRSNRSHISSVRLASFDNPHWSCPKSLVPVVADAGSQVQAKWMAAVCYSTLDCGEGGNLQIGFRTLSTKGSSPEASWLLHYGFQWKGFQSCGLEIYQSLTELQKDPSGPLFWLKPVFHPLWYFLFLESECHTIILKLTLTRKMSKLWNFFWHQKGMKPSQEKLVCVVEIEAALVHVTFPLTLFGTCRTVDKAFRSDPAEKTCTNHLLFNIFSWWSKAATFDSIWMRYIQHCENNICIYNHISIHCLPRRLCVLHLFKSLKCSLTHTHKHTEYTITCVFSPTLFENQLFFKQCSERHYMPDCNWCLWWCRATPSAAKRVAQGHRTSCEEKSSKQHACPVSVVYQSRQRKNQTRCLLRQQTCGCFSFTAGV